MQIICLITLMFMNGAYLFVSFNMEEMIVPDESEPETAQVMTISKTDLEFDPSAVLDLDIFDFDPEELANSHNSGSRSRSSRRAEDGIMR